MIKCPLCGCEFEEENAKTPCEACCVSKGCSNILCCPNCDYHLPVKSKVVEFITGLFRRKKDEARRD